MKTHDFQRRHLASAIAVAFALCSLPASAADVVVQTPSGGNFVIKDSTANVLMQVLGTGPVTIPFLTTAAQVDTVVCFDSTSGLLGQCAPAALGGGSSFSELTEGQTETTPTETTATTTTSAASASNSKGTILLAGAAAILLLCGIAFLIVRDARSVAPAGDGLLGKGGSGHDTAAMMRKRRAKAKAARRQRKQNIKRGE